MNCSIQGCANVAHCKGLCSTHRRRERIYGSPLITKNNPPGTGFEALGYRATQINGKKKFGYPDFPVDGSLCRAANDHLKGL